MDNPYKKYHGNIPWLPGQNIGRKFTDEEIDEMIREHEERMKEIEAQVAKAYGKDFCNIDQLKPVYSKMLEPFRLYEGVDPENELLTIVQEVRSEFFEGNIMECIPDTTYYYGITHWYDEHGFEVKSEIIDAGSLEDIKKYKEKNYSKTVYERKDGIIQCNGEDFCYDLGVKRLPIRNQEMGYIQIAKIVQNKNNPSETITMLVPVVMVEEEVDEKELLTKFDAYTSMEATTDFPEYQKRVEQLREYLKNGILIERHTLELKKEIYELRKEKKFLEINNRNLMRQLTELVNIIRKVKSTIIGRTLFTKKDKDIIFSAEMRYGESKRPR